MQRTSTTEPSETIREFIGTRTSAGIAALSFIEGLLLSCWLGSMMFFSFAVAPSAFAVLPSRHLAGTLVASVLTKLETLGLIAGPLLMILTAVSALRGRRANNSPTADWVARFVLLVVMVACAAISRIVVTPAIAGIRNSLSGVLDALPATDPSRIEFDRLHQYSVRLMATAMLAGLVVLFLRIQSWVRRKDR
jgi:hypothetical protein